MQPTRAYRGLCDGILLRRALPRTMLWLIPNTTVALTLRAAQISARRPKGAVCRKTPHYVQYYGKPHRTQWLSTMAEVQNLSALAPIDHAHVRPYEQILSVQECQHCACAHDAGLWRKGRVASHRDGRPQLIKCISIAARCDNGLEKKCEERFLKHASILCS